MNSFHSSVKYLRLINVKTALNTIKQIQPRVVTNTEQFNNVSKTITFSPRSIGVEIGQRQDVGKTKQDPSSYIPIINPRSILPIVDSFWRKEEIGLPSAKNEEIQAARLIVIRRKKMKKHQRRKLWKRMKHTWARVRQRRRANKEKIFQKELLALMKKANDFSAEQYVADKIAKANHVPLPTRWGHKHLPEFIIRQLMGIDKKINYKHTDIYKA